MVTRRRALLSASIYVTLTLAALSLLLLAASIRWEVSFRGTPFNHTWSISGGAFVAVWLTKEPDGSQSGFGNPGWWLTPRPSPTVSWLPHLTSFTSLHTAIVPLWPLPILLTLSAWQLARCRQRLPDPDSCRFCGYARRGLQPAAPCPECGRHT